MLSDAHHHRKSLRLKSYDYSWAGAYFITIVTQNRLPLFGRVEANTMILSPAGEMLNTAWHHLPTRFPDIELDASVIMPNHFHAILVFPTSTFGNPNAAPPINLGEPEQRVPTRGTPTEQPTLGTMIGAWKSLTTVAYIEGVKTQRWQPFQGRLWQRNFYEHVIRDEIDLARIRYYIQTNPLHWEQDTENPQVRA